MDANAYSVSSWGRSNTEDLTMPSDKNSKVKARRISLPMLVESGMLEKFDTISSVMDENVRQPAQGRKQPQDRKAKKPTKAEQKAKQNSKIGSAEMGAMMEMMLVLIPRIIVQPSVLPSMVPNESGSMVEIPEADREEGAIYSDQIPFTDQMFLFEWAMEGMDMEEVQSFRDKSDEGVEPLADESGVEEDAS